MVRINKRPVAHLRFWAGGPLKPGFGLSGAVLPLDTVFPLAGGPHQRREYNVFAKVAHQPLILCFGLVSFWLRTRPVFLRRTGGPHEPCAGCGWGA